MTKQIHIRLDDKIYNTLSEYSVITNKPVQDCVIEALALMLDDRHKERQVKKGKFTFIDLLQVLVACGWLLKPVADNVYSPVSGTGIVKRRILITLE